MSAKGLAVGASTTRLVCWSDMKTLYDTPGYFASMGILYYNKKSFYLWKNVVEIVIDLAYRGIPSSDNRRIF